MITRFATVHIPTSARPPPTSTPTAERFATVHIPTSARHPVYCKELAASFATVHIPTSARQSLTDPVSLRRFATVHIPTSARLNKVVHIGFVALPQFTFPHRQDPTFFSLDPLRALPQFTFPHRQDPNSNNENNEQLCHSSHSHIGKTLSRL